MGIEFCHSGIQKVFIFRSFTKNDWLKLIAGKLKMFLGIGMSHS